MKRKILSLTLASLVAVSLAACGQSSDQSGAEESAPSSTEQQDDAMSGAQAPTEPKVDRDPTQELPEITFSDDGIPSMKPIEDAPPKEITVKTLVEGDGAEVGPDDVVTIQYAGFLWDDGEQFDSSYDRGTPATFDLNGLIQAWKWGLAGTRVGDTVELIVPPEYGYGDQDQGSIPANSTLVFVIEIQDVISVDTAILEEASPVEAELPDGLTISGELGAEPKISFSAGAKMPAEPEVIVLAEGTGPIVTDADSVIVHYVATNWGSDDQAYSTWVGNTEQLPQAPTDLLGMRVGSRLALIVPGADEQDPGALMVVDIVAAFSN